MARLMTGDIAGATEIHERYAQSLAGNPMRPMEIGARRVGLGYRPAAGRHTSGCWQSPAPPGAVRSANWRLARMPNWRYGACFWATAPPPRGWRRRP